MSKQIQRSAQFGFDLIDCYSFIHRNNRDAAERFLAAVEQTLHRIVQMPGIGRRWESALQRPRDVRVYPLPGFRKYLLFYRSTATGIKALRLLHGARDLGAIIASLPQ